jgi:hypothetical protein
MRLALTAASLLLMVSTSVPAQSGAGVLVASGGGSA